MPQYFKKRKALAKGITATGSSIGGVIYPIMFYKSQQKVGFAWATRIHFQRVRHNAGGGDCEYDE
jgi:nitrate/nitrite transporter NarK